MPWRCMGGWLHLFLILAPDGGERWPARCTVRPLYLWAEPLVSNCGQSFWCPMNRDGPHSRNRYCAETINILSLLGTKPQFLGCEAHSLVTLCCSAHSLVTLCCSAHNLVTLCCSAHSLVTLCCAAHSLVTLCCSAHNLVTLCCSAHSLVTLCCAAHSLVTLCYAAQSLVTLCCAAHSLVTLCCWAHSLVTLCCTAHSLVTLRCAVHSLVTLCCSAHSLVTLCCPRERGQEKATLQRFEHKHMRAVLVDCNVWCLEYDEIIKVGLFLCMKIKMRAPYDKHWLVSLSRTKQAFCKHWRTNAKIMLYSLTGWWEQLTITDCVLQIKTHLMHAIHAV
jgi:hypothetical protein